MGDKKKLDDKKLKEILDRQSVLLEDEIDEEDLAKISGGMPPTGGQTSSKTTSVTKCCWGNL